MKAEKTDTPNGESATRLQPLGQAMLPGRKEHARAQLATLLGCVWACASWSPLSTSHAAS